MLTPPDLDAVVLAERVDELTQALREALVAMQQALMVLTRSYHGEPAPRRSSGRSTSPMARRGSASNG